jgi:hypothetical protein
MRPISLLSDIATSLNNRLAAHKHAILRELFGVRNGSGANPAIEAYFRWITEKLKKG